MAMKPFQAFPGQDHRAHVTAHLFFMATNFVRNNPSITASLEKNIVIRYIWSEMYFHLNVVNRVESVYYHRSFSCEISKNSKSIYGSVDAYFETHCIDIVVIISNRPVVLEIVGVIAYQTIVVRQLRPLV